MISCYHDYAHSGVPGLFDCGFNVGSRWIEQGGQAKKHQVLFHGLRCEFLQIVWKYAYGQCEYPEPLCSKIINLALDGALGILIESNVLIA